MNIFPHVSRPQAPAPAGAPSGGYCRSGRPTRQMALFAAAATTLLGGMVLATAGPAAASVDSPINSTFTVYTLQNQLTGNVADDLNQSSSAGNTIGAWSSNGGTNQQWTIASSTGSENGYYTIQNVDSQMCLDVSGQSTAMLAGIVQEPCDGSESQEWAINYTGSWSNGAPTVEIVNQNSGQYLNAGQAEGSGLLQSSVATNEDGGGWSNQWSLIRSSGGIPFILSATDDDWSVYPGNPVGTTPSNEVLDVPNWSSSWGTPLDVWPANGGDNQTWYLQEAGTLQLPHDTVDEYRIVNVYGNDWADARCLEAQGADPQNGAIIDQYGCDPNYVDQPNQLWVIVTWETDGTLSGATSASLGASDPGTELVNVATLSGADWWNSPSLTQSSNISPISGSTMTLMSSASAVQSDLPPTSQMWNLNQIEPGGAAGSGGGGAACSAFACLVS
jgi:Ricin-type beta-trefoil lectin domain-like